MRWRIAIAVLAAIGIAAAVYVGSQPKKGTVEWHKQRYLQAGAPSWALMKGVPGMVRDFYELRYLRESDLHQRALLDAGYLGDKTFVLSNASAPNVMQKIQLELTLPQTINEFTSMAWSANDSNAIRVIAPREWIEKIGQAIRETDVPESK
jgi:hypothetical protein